MKIAVIHDWLINPGGAEKVLREILDLVSNHDVQIYTLFDFLNEDDRYYYIHNRETKTSYLQSIPNIKNNYRYFLPLFPKAIRSFNLKEYDIIISSSHSVAKGVRKLPQQIHICYCHTPMRYVWDLRKQYLKDYKLEKGITKSIINGIMNNIRNWDLKTSEQVDYFISNSKNVQERIKMNYKRDAMVIYPPVDTKFYSPVFEKDNYYITASRMVPYKKIELIVEAFSNLPDKKLVVIGDGPDYKKIIQLKNQNIDIIKFDTSELLRHYLQKAKAFVFASNEDFGITPVESMACGTPIIGYGKGGLLETVIPDETGIFFQFQTTKSIIDAIYRFEDNWNVEKSKKCVKQAEKFTTEVFRKQMSQFLFEKANIKCSS